MAARHPPCRALKPKANDTAPLGTQPWSFAERCGYVRYTRLASNLERRGVAAILNPSLRKPITNKNAVKVSPKVGQGRGGQSGVSPPLPVPPKKTFIFE